MAPRIYTTFCLAIVLILTASCSSSKLNDNINGSFENNYDGENPDGWTSNQLPQTKNYVQFRIDNSVSHGGQKSISISISKTHPQTRVVYNWVRRVDGLKVAEIYEVSGWIKVSEIKVSPYIEMQCWNAKENRMIGSSMTNRIFRITGTKNWQRVDTILRVPESTTKIILLAGVESTDNHGGKVWFDDISLRNIKPK